MFKWPRLSKRQWRLVKTYTHEVHVKLPYCIARNAPAFYHLFESDDGKRRMEFKVSGETDNHQKVGETLHVYHEIIYPWLHGRVNPSIPTYSQIPEEETAVMLRGKV